VSGVTGWLRRRGEYPGPGIPASAVRYVEGDRDKAVRQRDAFATEVDQLQGRLIVLAERNHHLREALEASPDRVRETCLDLSDEVFELRRKNAELRRVLARYLEMSSLEMSSS
jgi:hypothetical protein